MKIFQGVSLFLNYQSVNLRKNTLQNYQFVLAAFQNYFGDTDLFSISSNEIMAFLSQLSENAKQSTKKLRFSLLSAFFNFIKNSVETDFQNPCDNPSLRKLFRASKPTQLKIIEKEAVDEIIFRTRNPRNRLMLELMARGCMRVGEVLKLTPLDIEDRKVTVRAPKSGSEIEVVFLTQKVAARLKMGLRAYNLLHLPRELYMAAEDVRRSIE